jgi:hypothetical protein
MDMAGEMQNGHDPSRLDRMEGMIEVILNRHIAFEEDHAQLLKAQVVLTDRLGQLTKIVVDVVEAQKRNEEAWKHTDERLNALITIVDNLIRNPPRPPQ